MIYGKPEDVFTCGLFSSTRGGFTMIYPLPSTQPCWKGSGTHCCGSGTDTFSPGDSWFVEQGTEVAWKVLTPVL
ncbi:DUF861 domain-containing protein [Salmonella enterica subsp. enterica serovar Kentucky]|nr:DUF861 domain-containing protein [Salmonella enterica subsp. enterica serovar Kentucky]